MLPRALRLIRPACASGAKPDGALAVDWLSEMEKRDNTASLVAPEVGRRGASRRPALPRWPALAHTARPAHARRPPLAGWIGEQF